MKPSSATLSQTASLDVLLLYIEHLPLWRYEIALICREKDGRERHDKERRPRSRSRERQHRSKSRDHRVRSKSRDRRDRPRESERDHDHRDKRARTEVDRVRPTLPFFPDLSPERLPACHFGSEV